MTPLTLLVLAVNLLVFGAHAILPFRLATGAERVRRRWAVVALPVLLAALVGTAVALLRRPDEAIAWGLVDPIRGSTPARLISLAVAALVLADLLLAVGWRRFEPAAWRVLGALGLLAAAAETFGSELLRNGWAPLPSLVALFAAAALRLPLTLAGGELLAGTPRLWAPVAGPALFLAARLWTPAMWSGLGNARWTLAAAALLLLGSRFAPQSLRRACGAAGLLLAVIVLARSAEVGRILGSHETVPDVLVSP
jgi:hypothetical protein